MSENDKELNRLRDALQLACQPQNAWRIAAGREQALSFPRAWAIEQIERIAETVLDLSDEWEYRRLLELAELLDGYLLQKFVARGLVSENPEVREAAEDLKRD